MRIVILMPYFVFHQLVSTILLGIKAHLASILGLYSSEIKYLGKISTLSCLTFSYLGFFTALCI